MGCLGKSLPVFSIVGFVKCCLCRGCCIIARDKDMGGGLRSMIKGKEWREGEAGGMEVQVRIANLTAVQSFGHGMHTYRSR